EVPHGPVRDHAHAAERAVDVGLHLAPLRALAARVVEVVDDHYARGGDAEDEVPPPEDARAVPLDRAALGPDDRGARVADHRPHLREEGANVRRQVALLARTHLERLDGIGDAGTRDLLERIDLV